MNTEIKNSKYLYIYLEFFFYLFFPSLIFFFSIYKREKKIFKELVQHNSLLNPNNVWH